MSPFTTSTPATFSRLKRQAWMLFGMLLALLSPYLDLKACGWYEPDPESQYIFYSPEVYRFENLQAFHFTYERLYDYSLLDTKVSEDANIESWAEHIWPGEDLTKARAEELRKLIYGTPAEDIRVLKEFIQGKGAAPYPARTWSVTTALKNKGFAEEMEYLMVAKEIEPYVGFWDEWEERPEQDLNDVKTLAEDCFKSMASAQNEFVRGRYGYQGVRILHRNNLFKECVEAWEKHMSRMQPGDLTFWWSLGDYAGALRHLNRNGEAAYHFARVFDHCPSRRIQAWYSWRVQDEATWNEALSMCKTPEDKAVLLFMRNAKPEAVVSADLRNILEVAPNSPYLQLLAVREVNKLEDQTMGYQLQHKTPFFLGFKSNSWSSSKLSEDELSEFIRLVASAKSDPRMLDKDFWNITHAYLLFLSGKFDAANQDLRTLMPTLKQESKAKAAVVQMAIMICSTKTADTESEQRLLTELEQLIPKVETITGERLRNLLDEGLGLLYMKQGELAKSMLAINQAYMLWDKGTMAEVEEMIAFVDRPKRSRYEEILQKRLGEDAKFSLQELRGTRLMGEDRLEEAIMVFEALPEDYKGRSETFSLEDNPFRPALIDVINCYDRDCDAGSYDKLSFAKRVVELRKQTLSADPKRLGGIYLELGHAFYNTSFYGPAWRTMDYQRRDTWYTYNYYGEKEEGKQGVDEIRDRKSMQLAARYYGWAAENAANKEQMAEALFHMAKAEQNTGYLDGMHWLEQKREAFDKLMTFCRGTSFYRRVVKECKYLAFYSSR